MTTATVSQLASGRSSARRAGAGLPRALLALVLAAGCGGKHADTTPSGGEAGEAGEGEAAAHQSAEIIPPEKMDEVNRSLARKREVMSRCLATAIDNNELPKNSAGKVTLELVIGTSGKADSVKVVRATLASKSLNECIIDHVKEIDFPELPRPYETSYTYGFEDS